MARTRLTAKEGDGIDGTEFNEGSPVLPPTTYKSWHRFCTLQILGKAAGTEVSASLRQNKFGPDRCIWKKLADGLTQFAPARCQRSRTPFRFCQRQQAYCRGIDGATCGAINSAA